jgi:hypothetical protein
MVGQSINLTAIVRLFSGSSMGWQALVVDVLARPNLILDPITDVHLADRTFYLDTAVEPKARKDNQDIR